ncbi:MAG: ATP phosphoribosyltransferase [Aestuariivita sp.]|nr:ATP phosphoribosyltransferase [Aestuariivita sp.]MCY4201192.1 ATP phosphoribosyltransferase [Aestuariivita sp.]
MVVRVAIPSKGRLLRATLDWLSGRGFQFKKLESERRYEISTDSVKGLDFVLLPAAEIPRELATGRIHFGVTGTDLIYEKLPRHSTEVIEKKRLGFGLATLVIAVPCFWIDVDTLDDLDAVAADFRERHNMRLRVATKYHHLTRKFLGRAGVADYALVDSQGSTEGAIKNELADVISDITSTGETLRQNHLKILSDGIILKSQATLWESCKAEYSQGDRETQAAFLTKLIGIEY